MEKRAWVFKPVEVLDAYPPSLDSTPGRAQELFGYSCEEMVGEPIAKLVPPERLDQLNEIRASVRRGEHVQPLETTRVTRNGHEIEVSLSVSLIYDAAGQITGSSSISRDISDRKQSERLVQHMADHDQLTGLHNRRGFITLADHQLKVSARRGCPVPLLFIDIDGMKAVRRHV